MKSKVNCFFLPLISIIAINSWTSCSKKKKDQSEQQFLIRTAIPKTYELRDGVYPVETCIPLQLQATDNSGTPIALTNNTTVKFNTIDISDENAKNIHVGLYSGEKCDVKIEQSVLPGAESPKPSIVKIYFKSSDVGHARVTFSYGGGSWIAKDMILIDFETKPNTNSEGQ